MRWNCNDGTNCYHQWRSDPSMLDGCFAGRSSLGDIDGCLELNRHFLYVDFKHDGVSLNEGQRRLQRNLLLPPRSVTILVVHAHGDEVFKWSEKSSAAPTAVPTIHEGDVDDLRHFAWEWSKRVDPGRTPGQLSPYRRRSVA